MGDDAAGNRPSGLFDVIAALNGDRPWGRFLDAGTGVASASWAASLATMSWTGVSASAAHLDQVRRAVGGGLRPSDALVLGNWMEPGLLAGARFDTVLADYVLGAVEGFGPYFQTQFFKRLRPLTAGRLYVVGLDPYVVGDAPTPASRVVRAIGRLRDACLVLADETPYREYPAEWVIDQLGAAGFDVRVARRFGNRYRERWVNGQLDMARRRLAKIPDRKLAGALGDRIDTLRREALALCRQEGGLRHGADYVIAAEAA